MAPKFLTLDEVQAIHRDQVERYGGSHGVRDRGLLESAVAMPSAMFSGQYLHGDLCEMAAAYLFHLAQNHAFMDGNKRVAAVSADVFLAMNGLRLAVSQEDFYSLAIQVATGTLTKPAVADFFRAHTEPL